jgi:hypothetical protein
MLAGPVKQTGAGTRLGGGDLTFSRITLNKMAHVLFSLGYLYAGSRWAKCQATWY